VYCGAIEEMEDWQVAGQIESSFLNCTNVMEVMVPVFKRQKYGHFIAVTDINASSGGSGVGVLSGAQQAVESFCEGIALSLLSFNIRVTIVQTDAEVTLLTNPVVFSKPLPKYKSTLVDKTRDILASSTRFPTKAFDNTLSAITSIAGIKDPPGRLFVGENVIDQVKNKLTTFSEELDNYTD
jgi:NAD(P)-dependent dehydrogenase (short-subunit alcohol dehydrogenase family)